MMRRPAAFRVAVLFGTALNLFGCSSSRPPTSTAAPTSTTSPCSFAISPATASFAATGGSQVVNVSATPAGCSPAGWTATTASPLLSVSPTTGAGNGSVTVTAAANTATPQQTLTATIAGQSFAATIAGVGCAYAFSANAPDVGGNTWMVPWDASERGATVTVTPNDGSCPPWTATTTADWITLKPVTATTSATVRVDYSANTALTGRVGSVSFTPPTCAGSNCGFTVGVNQAGRALVTLNLTLVQAGGLNGPLSAVVTGPGGLSCSITYSQRSVVCPPVTFPNGSTVDLEERLTTTDPLPAMMWPNSTTFGCDATKYGSAVATCTVIMAGDRSVTIGVDTYR